MNAVGTLKQFLDHMFNGPEFDSDWALVDQGRDGRLLRYQFHADTAALVAALA